ncbi:diguanylate cyclase [Alteromonas sp. CYL-A6]|uniref:diguanylate cyclase n=1 Tax=Alteromonas nitratireducens TaxID=3390813 RepID=UPI0034BC370D
MIKLDVKPLAECLVLIVDDDPVSQALLSTLLSDMVQCAVVTSGEEALAYCRAHLPDLILMDMNLPGKSGITVCQELKAEERLEDVPVLFVTSSIDPETEDHCWEAGASDFLLKPVTASTLQHRVNHHLQSKLRMELLESMTIRDQLTGLHNRIYLASEVPQLVGGLARYNAFLAAIVIDIDFFKHYNDTKGHLEGDKCLRKVAETLQTCTHRTSDLCIRFGGEEFVILLPETDEKGAIKVAELMVTTIRELGLAHEGVLNDRVTISAGVAVCHAKACEKGDISMLLRQADDALYLAKEKGRDRVQAASAMSDVA